MATIQQLKDQIDLHDLADKLGIKRGKGNKANYYADAKDKAPSLAVYQNGTKWKDFRDNDTGGSCVDLVMFAEGVEAAEAINRLHELYGLEKERPASSQDAQPNRQKSTIEYIADKCKGNEDKIMQYLMGRGISEAAITHAIKKGMLGFNTYTGSKAQPGEFGYGGPAVAFMVKDLNTSQIKAVDMRYLDAALNGDVKTQTQGDKYGHVWTSDIQKLKKAKAVYIVESPINALSVDSCEIPYSASFALRGTGNVDNIDIRFLIGKKVIICLDNDKQTVQGKYPGQQASWALHARLSALNIACHLVDQTTWDDSEYNDVNDIIQNVDTHGLKVALSHLQSWCIPGVCVADDYQGPAQVWLPAHDFTQYWRFRVKEDFTTYIKKRDMDDDGNESLEFMDLCGFRVAGISRITVAGAVATMTGEEDTSPRTQFAVSVQTPRHGNKLIRRVFEDERLHNVDQWRKFGPVYSQNSFLRMLNILERAAHIGAREAVNFVGLAWKQGKPTVNEGPDCYFTDPDKQCPYHNLSFPSGSRADARKVIHAYQATFKNNAAMHMLMWALGGHLKAFLGFWPHLILQADKGSGKSVLTGRLARTIAFTMFSGQSLQTEYRLLTSISGTSHPVGWEELSARSQQIIDKAVSLLQECYGITTTRRGGDMTEYLIAAPVLLAGEDVPVKSLTGKVVRTNLSQRKGELLPEDLPRFPVLEWIQFLAEQSRADILDLHKRAMDHCHKHCRAEGKDEGAARMVHNYASLLVGWRLLCSFAEIPKNTGDFESDLIVEMNSHISETSGDREPWVWIMETLFSEISSHRFNYPFKFVNYRRNGEPTECLLVRATHIMQHFKHSPHLKDTYNSLPVKSDRVLKRQLTQADVIHKERVDTTIAKKRESHMLALSIDALEGYGLHVSRPEDLDELTETIESGHADA